MRRLISREEREKKRKRNQVVVGIILVFLMFASTIGYAVQGNLGNPQGITGNSNITYNGAEFSYINGFWVYRNLVFRLNPYETPNIGSGLKSVGEYQGKLVYVQSEDVNSETEIYVNLGPIASIQKGCLEGTTCAEGIPVKTCADNFIIIRESTEEKITQSENCVYIEGRKDDLIKLTDEFLFKILGIK